MAKGKILAGVVDFTINQGDDYYFQLEIKSDNDKPIDITGCEFRCKAKVSAEDENVAFTAEPTIISGKDGKVLFHFKDEDTRLIDTDGDTYAKHKKYTYDVLMKNTQGDVTRLLNGTIFVSPGISWDDN